jgi:lipoprotein-anchoring transpeptidase ErfK/SrfK
VRCLVVDVPLQRIGLVVDGALLSDDLVSTSVKGVGGEHGSEKTPVGWHRVKEKIGAEAPEGTVFVGRKEEGDVWHGEPRAEDLVLSRILVLDGLEDGINRGGEVDSLARFIYVHGTNDEASLGMPASHGCVRMGNKAVVALFDRVAVGEYVVIIG